MWDSKFREVSVVWGLRPSVVSPCRAICKHMSLYAIYTTEILSPGKKYQRFHTKGKFISNSKPRTLDKNLQGKRFQTLKHEINPKKPTLSLLKGYTLLKKCANQALSAPTCRPRAPRMPTGGSPALGSEFGLWSLELGFRVRV